MLPTRTALIPISLDASFYPFEENDLRQIVGAFDTTTFPQLLVRDIAETAVDMIERRIGQRITKRSVKDYYCDWPGDRSLELSQTSPEIPEYTAANLSTCLLYTSPSPRD